MQEGHKILRQLSVVMPFYNREAWLPDTLRSIEQSPVWPGVLLFVDNGSTDKSRDLCAQTVRHMEKEIDARILSCPRRGATAARNYGLSEVTTEWVYFFDSDDLWSADFLTDMGSLLPSHAKEEGPAVNVFAFRTNIVTDGGGRIVKKVSFSQHPAPQILLSHLATQNMCMRTSFVREIGGWRDDLSYHNDWELGVRATIAMQDGHHGTLSWLKDKVYHTVRIHSDSITGTGGFAARYHDLLAALAAVRDDIGKADDKPDGPSRQTVETISAAAGRCRQSLLAALSLREAILAGHLRREGAAAEAKALLREARRDSGWWLVTMWGRLAYQYVRRGGRGANRLMLAVWRWLYA